MCVEQNTGSLAGYGQTDYVEQVTGDGLGDVARILATAFTEDPVFAWAMPKADTRVEDAAAFFTFYLRRNRTALRDVFATVDRTAVAVMTTVRPESDDLSAGTALSFAGRSTSPATDYFRWIESFRPTVPHRFLEFIGSSGGSRSRGKGTILLKKLLQCAVEEGLPVWTWSSNPLNLSFYHRLGFQAGAELCRDNNTPSVTPLLRLPVPLEI